MKKKKHFLKSFQMEKVWDERMMYTPKYRINGIPAYGITKVSIEPNSDNALTPARVTITFECENIEITNTKAPQKSGADVQSL